MSSESRRGKHRRSGGGAGGKSGGQETTTTKSAKIKPGKPEFKMGDSVLFNVHPSDEVGTASAIAIADGVYKKQKFDLASLSTFVGVDPEVINERLEHALKFPSLRPLPLDTDARSHPYVVDGRHLSLMDDCNIPRMTSRRRAMVLKSFVFRQSKEATDLVKEPTIEKAIKKLKAQLQSLLKNGEKNSMLGLYRNSGDHVSRITRAMTTKSFPALTSVTKNKYIVEWTDELGASWRDENVLLIGFDEIQSVNEWGKHRLKSRGPASNFWFCLREEESKGNGKTGKPGKIALDKDLFWSVAFFFNEIGTCGVEDWDEDLKAMRKRANEMTSDTWEYQVKKVEPDFVPIIAADAIWKKAKDAANDNYRRGKELREVLMYYKAAIKELREKYGEEGNVYRDFMKSECAKLYTNMAATFYKIHEIGSNPRNDLQAALGAQEYKITWDEALEESFEMAKKATTCNELWWKGYFYAARALHHNKKRETSLRYIQKMVGSASINSAVQPLKIQEVIDFLVEIKYFTHLKHFKESPIWHHVSHRSNVFVVCPKGAGHFKHPVEAVNTLRAGGKLSDRVACTLIIRPGTYKMDMDPNLQEECEELSDSEENFVALRNASSSGIQFSASIILRDGETLEIIGDFPALDHPTYDCGHQGAMNKTPLATFCTSGRIGQHMFSLEGEKSSLTLKRLYIKHYVRHPCILLPHAVAPSMIRTQGKLSELNVSDSKIWTSTLPAIHTSGGHFTLSNSSLTDSGCGFIFDSNSKITIRKCLITDVTTTIISSKDSTVSISDTFVQNVGGWDKDHGIISRGGESRLEMTNCQYLCPKVKESSRGAVMMRGGSLSVTHCDFYSHKIDPYHGVIDVRDTGSFVIEWNEFHLSGSDSNTCALKIVNDATGQFRYNRIQDGWKALLIEDQTKNSLENLEIGGNAWEAISGKKILVHEFEGPTTIDGFKSQEIESVPPEQAIAKKISALKLMLADDNRRKKLMLPQPKEERSHIESLKEINRLRKMAPLRCEEVKVRFHLDRRCGCCRKFEHVLGPCVGSFKVCDRCKYRGDMYCSRECQMEHWPVHKNFCKKYKDIMKSVNN